MAELQNWNIGGNFLSGYERGRQQARSDRFSALAGQALSARPQDRDALIQQAVALDPEAGFELQKRLETDTANRQKTLYNMARGFKQIHGQNPQAASAFYTRQLVPGLQRLGFEVSPEYNEAEVLPVVEQVLAAFGEADAGDQVQGQFVTRDGRVGYLTRSGRPVVTDVQVAPQTQLISQEGQTPFLAVTGRGNIGSTIGIGGQGEAPPAAPQGGPVVAHPQTGERGRYSIGPDGLPVFIAEGVAPATQQAIQSDPAGFAAGGVFQGAPQFVEPQAPAPVRNPTQAEQAAASTTARIQAERELERPQDIAKDEQAFRKEVNARLDEPRKILSAYQRVQTAAANPSAANDLALIFGYMKMLDPGSVVREGEFANAQNAAGVPDRVINAYNRALNGKFLNDGQRAEFVASADQQANVARGQITSAAREYQDTARAYGFDPVRATGLADFSGVSASTQRPQAPRNLPRPTTQAEYDRLPSGAAFIDPDDGKTYRKP